MKNDNENQKIDSRQSWVLKFVVAALLMIVGYKSPPLWLAVSTTIWVGYIVSILALPLIIAASQSNSLAKIAKRALAVWKNVATAALISVPIVLLHWYGVSF